MIDLILKTFAVFFGCCVAALLLLLLTGYLLTLVVGQVGYFLAFVVIVISVGATISKLCDEHF